MFGFAPKAIIIKVSSYTEHKDIKSLYTSSSQF